MTDERCLDCVLTGAVLDGDLAAVEAALRAGADPNSDSDCNTALFDALQGGCLEVVGRLLKAGTDMSRTHPITHKTPLATALEAQQADSVQELVRHSVDLSSVSLPALVRGEDRPEMVRLALSAGLDLNAPDPETGRTALHEAAMYGYLDTVTYLLREGADVSTSDKWGNTPATAAECNHHEEIARLLMDCRWRKETSSEEPVVSEECHD